MNARILTITLTLGTVLAAAAAAQPGRRGPGTDLWDNLAADFDKDQDGRITREELAGAEATFEHLDRNGDGVLSQADFDRGPGRRGPRMGFHGPGPGGPMAGLFLVHLADGDGDGAVTSAELDAFLAELDADGDGRIAEDELRAAVVREGFRGRGPRGDRPRMHTPFDHDGDGVLEVEDFRAAFAELDENGDGTVGGDELPAFGRGPHGPMGGGPLARRADADGDGTISRAEWQAFVARLDADGNGEIGYEEWHAAGPGDREPRPERFEILRVFDFDGDGVLETADFDALFTELDTDGSGAIEQDELPRHRFHHHRG